MAGDRRESESLDNFIGVILLSRNREGDLDGPRILPRGLSSSFVRSIINILD